MTITRHELLLAGAIGLATLPALAGPPSGSGLPELRARIAADPKAAIDESYRNEFTRCDGSAPLQAGKDQFRGYSLRRPGKPENEQYYLCSRDPANVTVLARLRDGGIYWQSKMALDVDGSWAAWSGIPGATDQKETSYKWAGVADRHSRAAQLDPDTIPFVVIPMDGLTSLTGNASWKLGAEFTGFTKLGLGDMGVAILGDRWTPVIIGDGGPFMRLGEGSARVFEALGQSRCKKWNAAQTRCEGDVPGKYPYRNFGIDRGVTFILYPDSYRPDLSPATALRVLCDFAKVKLGLTGSSNCPAS